MDSKDGSQYDVADGREEGDDPWQAGHARRWAAAAHARELALEAREHAVEAREHALEARDHAVEAREHAVEARESAHLERVAAAQAIMAAADERDAVSDARDTVAEEREEGHDRAEMLDLTSEYGADWPRRRDAQLDREHAKGDRTASREDRKALTGGEEARPMTEDDAQDRP